ncbi:hypothetical protein Gotri_001342 [Gossypium trilobum]|uniref:RNase H type-1 domain-containing protein n=1 Tax=Gossypium trilobum TaxID=34281 RepID=A0A7J9FEF9_9ROSI|nr:hypothetical protein [Gossypium trilobum]
MIGNWVFLNTDGAIKMGSRIAAVEGVLQDGNENWILGHVPRENDKAADCLTKMTFDKETGVQVFDIPPREALATLDSDKTNDIFAL